MASTDPRRSSRARTAQTPSLISSTTSSVSGRTERNTRACHNRASPQKSTTTTASLSSEPPEDVTAEETFAMRRRTRGQGEEKNKMAKTAVTTANGSDDMQEEDEAVRCICGFDDYPGPPPMDEDSKQGLKDSTDPIFATDLNDDAAGFFVQCDVCKVWQHGACVGIMTEEASPDEYFCEQCRKDLHKIFSAKNGSTSRSTSQQVKETSKSSPKDKDKEKDKEKEKERDGRNGRAASMTQTSKRRSTMNSREAAYDEAEALRRAIEASKEEALHDHADGNTRRPKRGRSDSEEKQESVKRQRTSSRSASPTVSKAGEESDEELTGAKKGHPKSSRTRTNAAFRHERAEKAAEKEERERQRAEAANKRKGRAERRRADGAAPNSTETLAKESETLADADSDPSEELPLAARAHGTRAAQPASMTAREPVPSTAAVTSTPAALKVAPEPPPPTPQLAVEGPPSSQPAPDTPALAHAAPAKNEKKRSHKKKGRNQYTRDLDVGDERSPARSQSRDLQKDDTNGPKNGGDNHHHAHQGGHHNSSNGGTGKHAAKSKGSMPSKVNMADMKRRASALLEFISRTQIELAGEALPLPDADEEIAPAGPVVNGHRSEKDATSVPRPNANGDVPHTGGEQANGGTASPTKDFKDLSCMEMMDSLTKRLIKWQQEYAS